MKPFKISVIVPFFNSSMYLEKCIQSLFQQSLNDIEFIFVDDGSTDNSITLLKKLINQYPYRKNSVKLISQPTNMGSATSRNVGLNNATGKYIAWVDADDWIEKDMFLTLWKTAEQKNADLVWCPFYIEFSDRKQIDYQIMDENARCFARALITGDMQGMLWNKLIRKRIFDENRIRFLDGCNMAEDRNVLFKVLCFCSIVSYVDEPMYYYVQFSPNAMTRDVSPTRTYEEIENGKDLAGFIERSQINWVSIDDLNKFLFRSKKKLLFSKSLIDFKRWRDVFPESNKFFINSNLSTHHKLLAFCARYRIWVIIRIWVFLKKQMEKKTNHQTYK